MSKRDGKMYLCLMLQKRGETSIGIDIDMTNDDVAGYAPVYWTKTAARRDYGKNVKLVEIATDE